MLLFDAASHTYTLDGKVVPGVTSILKPLIDLSGIPKDVLEAKRQLGTDVHLACQLLNDQDLDEESIEPQVRGYLTAYQRFLVESGAKVMASEMRVHEPAVNFAGTLDLILHYRGVGWVVDIKSSIATPISTGPQTAAYLRAVHAHDATIGHRAALRLRPDGKYRFDPLQNPNDWSAFVACLTIHRFKESFK